MKKKELVELLVNRFPKMEKIETIEQIQYKFSLIGLFLDDSKVAYALVDLKTKSVTLLQYDNVAVPAPTVAFQIGQIVHAEVVKDVEEESIVIDNMKDRFIVVVLTEDGDVVAEYFRPDLKTCLSTYRNYVEENRIDEMEKGIFDDEEQDERSEKEREGCQQKKHPGGQEKIQVGNVASRYRDRR